MQIPNPCGDIGIVRGSWCRFAPGCSLASLTATSRARSRSASSCKYRRADCSLMFSPVANSSDPPVNQFTYMSP